MIIAYTEKLFCQAIEAPSPELPLWQQVAQKIFHVVLALALTPFTLLLDLFVALTRTPPLLNRITTFHGETLREAVEWGLSFQDAKTKRLYLDLIVNEGILEEGEPPIEIFQWTAACQVIQRQLQSPEPVWSGPTLLSVVAPSIEQQLTHNEKVRANKIHQLAQEVTQTEAFRKEFKDLKGRYMVSSWPCQC